MESGCGWNHYSSRFIPSHSSSDAQNFVSISTKPSAFFVCDLSFSSSNQYGPTMPFVEIATHAVHFVECNGLLITSAGVDVDQQTLLLLFTCPESRKWALSENQRWPKKSGLAKIMSQNHSHMVTRFSMTTSVSFCVI